MIIHHEFKELLRILEKHNVDYMIVGGYAVAFHGFPRFTKDLDIFYRRTLDNTQRLSAALVEFGFEERDIENSRLLEKGDLVAFGIPPLRVDLLNDIDGITFDEASPGAILAKFDDVPARFIDKEYLIKNKSSTTRLQDKLDLEKLM